jgi:hypothetical protein
MAKLRDGLCVLWNAILMVVVARFSCPSRTATERNIPMMLSGPSEPQEDGDDLDLPLGGWRVMLVCRDL